MKADRAPSPVYYCTTIAVLLILLCSCSERAGKSEGKALRYNQATVAALDREIMNSPNDKRYLAILKGLRWCVIFCDDDKNFDFTFTNYVTMLDELSLRNPDSALAHIVHDLILKEFDRALPRLSRLFSTNEDEYGRFISKLPIIYHHKVPVKPFKEFADRNFAGIAFSDRLKEFRKAAKKRDYDRLTDLLVRTAFIDMDYRWGADKDFRLPPNHYQTIMKECADIPFLHRYKDTGYFDQNYFATHVVLALTHYGQRPFQPSATGDKMFFYLTGQYETVRHRMDDLDLLCEYLYCFRQFAIRNAEFISEGEQYVMSLQRDDGAWGEVEDPDKDPYDRLHPTWTAITLLVQGVGN